jgi:hypothetical protein
MDNPVDHIADLGLVNYVRHPTNPDYMVYRFGDQARADSFEKALQQAGIEFERAVEERPQRNYHLFAIHKNDYKKTIRMNFMVEAEHKKPLIPFKAFRYFLILFSAFVLTLAMIGYCKQQEKLASHNNTDTSELSTQSNQ